jgi:hypothetical protein
MKVKRVTRGQLVSLLREHGYPIGKSTLDKLCMPAINEGPPVAAWWGRRPLYDPDEALTWAEKRTRRPESGDACEGAAAGPSLGDVPGRFTTKAALADGRDSTATDARSGRS